ncbi:hypothetical protein ACH4GK_17795 [Streptomyces rimosus]|uniref:hypothetical protein n=1 Tax=Streptomyces rimosus TaxID=1927 RepID=UPI0004C6F046|nr:hypothetical protein [Streptomyces rimosus]
MTTIAEQRTDASQSRQMRHALTALAKVSPGQRRRIREAAEEYLSQVEYRRLPAGYKRPLIDERVNRADAFKLRRGNLLARLLGISCRPDDEDLPDTARAVIAACEAPVTALTEAAQSSGDPVGVAVAYVVAGTFAASHLAH